MRNGLIGRTTSSILDDLFKDEFLLSVNSNSHIDVYQEANKYVVEVTLMIKCISEDVIRIEVKYTKS